MIRPVALPTPTLVAVAFGGGVGGALAAATSPPPGAQGWSDYGVLGGLAILLIAFARTAYKRESDGRDAAEAKYERQNAAIQDRYLPALEGAVAALRDQAAATQVSNQLADDLRDLLADLRREMSRLHYGAPADDPDPPPRPTRPRQPARRPR